MRSFRFISNSVLIISCGILLSCSPAPQQQIQQKQEPPGVYDSAFPTKNSSIEISHIFNSIKRINSTVYYNTYLFDMKDKITDKTLDTMNVRKLASDVVSTTQSAAGTATIIEKSNQGVALLTCAHIITFPDTVVNYFKRPNLTVTNYIKSVSFKEREGNIILDLPDLGHFKVLARDPISDIAVLGADVSEFTDQNIQVFNYPIGEPHDLQWGSFVYILGYPQGYQMVTRALVSQPDRNNYGSFILDALFNKGFSGGLVLAIRGGVPNFEWVGMANSATAKVDYVMVPEDSKIDLYDSYTPYKGDIYIDHKTHIEYGITQAVSMDRIKKFLKRHRKELGKEGYNFSRFIGD
ncbi:MAG TPA: serine protease [Balneolales bacterium]|nr:serine protease [Balneolales bacterium]